MSGMGAHQSAKMLNDEWLTPPEIVLGLGPFNLDPCAPVNRPWNTAAMHYTIHDDGLSKPWHGHVWLNPPYGRSTGSWLNKLAEHGDGIALIFARTETKDFVEQVWSKATALLFLHGRLYFHYVDGTRAAANAGAPSVLVAYGEYSADRLAMSDLPGTFIWLHREHHKGIASMCGVRGPAR